ncbi:hypothetical protein F5B22DRAFT_600360 [Xylaria bambusicola]|uniref:uncharacterized protein n=1 Tax=Xylaria bambusicola TaxID=326684 RepID=UPI0020078A96|nr:uncharacterized protein F5B22DRAFT_600360 [Xylaria bambusicola]KAI0518225.1 hypothetical protein F5B22DRAFT_600360 [Xylaria bambusicola]
MISPVIYVLCLGQLLPWPLYVQLSALLRVLLATMSCEDSLEKEYHLCQQVFVENILHPMLKYQTVVPRSLFQHWGHNKASLANCRTKKDISSRLIP